MAFQQISTGAASVTMIDNHPADDYGFMGRGIVFLIGKLTAWGRLAWPVLSVKKRFAVAGWMWVSPVRHVGRFRSDLPRRQILRGWRQPEALAELPSSGRFS